jgi:predicted Fe-Mo cluster-binding NifX family protein
MCIRDRVRPDDSRVVLDVRNMSITEKAEMCKKEGSTVLICGAISIVASSVLTAHKIKVISWVSGSIIEIVEAFRHQADITEIFSMPGCKSRICKKRQTRLRRGCCKNF